MHWSTIRHKQCQPSFQAVPCEGVGSSKGERDRQGLPLDALKHSERPVLRNPVAAAKINLVQTELKSFDNPFMRLSVLLSNDLLRWLTAERDRALNLFDRGVK